MILLKEFHFTYLTAVRPLLPTCVLMSDQIYLLTEYLITYFTGKTTLSTVYL